MVVLLAACLVMVPRVHRSSLRQRLVKARIILIEQINKQISTRGKLRAIFPLPPAGNLPSRVILLLNPASPRPTPAVHDSKNPGPC